MLEKIIENLKKNQKVADWTIVQDQNQSTEVFLVKDQLDLNRSAQVEEFRVKVFVDFEDQGQTYRGEAQFHLGVSESQEEIQDKIESAVFAAGFVKNPWYPLPQAEPGPYLPMVARTNRQDLADRFADLHKVLYQAYPYQAQVNSCEVFAIDGWRRVLNSQGVDHAYPRHEFSFELVTDAGQGLDAVEIFNGYYLTHLDLAQVESIVKQQLRDTQGRYQAQPAKKIDQIRVILSTDAVETFLEFYRDQATDQAIFTKISRLELGQLFQGSEAREKLNLRVNPVLASSIYSRPVDEEGKKLQAHALFEDGRAVDLVTSAKYSHYLGLENRGYASTFEVQGGQEPLAHYLTGTYLEILTFSDFQMDPVTGDFGGEFRLARLVEEGKETYLTAGAISDNIFRVQDQMVFSKERVQRTKSLTPQAIIFDDLAVTGN